MGVEYKDYYKLLNVSRNASKEEISKAFKKLARKCHPDLNQADKEAETKFKDINEAYEVLKDEKKRKLYDQLGANWKHGQNFQQPQGFEGFNFGGASGGFNGANFAGSGFSDFFESMFGGAGRGQSFGADPFGSFSRRPQRGRDVEADLKLTLEEVYKGGPKTIAISSNSGEKSLEINIPAGVKEGAKIRLAGQGDPAPGGTAGDLFLRVKLLPNSNFIVENNDVIYELNLAPWEAALGIKVQIPTLDSKVELNVPACSSSGKKFRLRGKGMGSGANKGDQYVRLNIRMPEALSEQEKELWEQMAQLSTFAPRD